MADGGRDVDGLVTHEPLAAKGELRQRINQSLLLLAARRHGFGHRAEGGCVRVRIGQRHLCECKLESDWGAELVRHVGGKAFLAIERRRSGWCLIRRHSDRAARDGVRGAGRQCGPLASRATFARVIAPCVTPTQASAAAMNAGALRSTPAAWIICPVICPWGSGSGKPVMPWVRRQRANARNTCLDGSPAWLLLLGAVRIPLHAFCAEWKAGAALALAGPAIAVATLPSGFVVICGSG